MISHIIYIYIHTCTPYQYQYQSMNIYIWYMYIHNSYLCCWHFKARLSFWERYVAGAPGSVPKLGVAAAIGQHLGAGCLQRQPGQLHHRWWGISGDLRGSHFLPWKSLIYWENQGKTMGKYRNIWKHMGKTFFLKIHVTKQNWNRFQDSRHF